MKPSYTLKELKVPLIDLQTCNNYYQKESLLHGVKPISEDMICSRLPVGPTDQCRVRTYYSIKKKKKRTYYSLGTFQSAALPQCASSMSPSFRVPGWSQGCRTGPNPTALGWTIGESFPLPCEWLSHLSLSPRAAEEIPWRAKWRISGSWQEWWAGNQTAAEPMSLKYIRTSVSISLGLRSQPPRMLTFLLPPVQISLGSSLLGFCLSFSSGYLNRLESVWPG